MSSILVGCGAGFSGDRIDAAGPVVKTLIRRGGAAAIMFENLAERTLALQQLAMRANPALGYEPLLELEVGPILKDCIEHGITIVGNFGAANPHGAAQCLIRMARQQGLPKPRVAVITGDDLSGPVFRPELKRQLGDAFDEQRFVCANAYLGAFEIARAIRDGAQIVVTGRVSDPSLALGPAIAHHGWSRDDLDALAGATMAGHLLECGAQVTGGYFADPGKKEVPAMHQIGFPVAEIFADGSCLIGKADDSGGLVDLRTVKEQLLYEVHDPSSYITPDVVADITQCQLEDIGNHQVRLSGVIGHARPANLKTLAYFDGGWLGEAEISYAGPNAQARARLAAETLEKRLGHLMPLRFDLIGLVSLFGDDAGQLFSSSEAGQHHDVRMRIAGKHESAAVVDRLLQDTLALWTCGPAGGGGVRTSKRQRLSNQSCLIPRELIPVVCEFV